MLYTASNPSAPATDRCAVLLSALHQRAASGPDWIHEIKYDGFRIQARRHGKNPAAPAVKREAEGDWGQKRQTRERLI